MFVNWKFKIIIIPNSLAKRLSHDVRLEDEISVEILNSVCLISFESIDLRHFRSLSSDLSGFIAPPIPLASPYLDPYSEHTTVLKGKLLAVLSDRVDGSAEKHEALRVSGESVGPPPDPS